MRVAFLVTIVFDKFLISPKLYILIIHYPTSSVDISKLIIYYADFHNADEDLTTITAHGGYQAHGNQAGIAYRTLLSIPSNSQDSVASKKINR